MADVAREAAFPPDAELFRQSAPATHLYLLLEGQVALSSTAPDGSSAVVEVIRAPGYVVLASILSGGPHLMTARTVTSVRALTIEAEDFTALLETEVSLANAFLRAEACSLSSIVHQVQDLKLRSTPQRLACYLLALAGETQGAAAHFRLPFEKGLLAARLGCRQENLSRAFAMLRNYGVETRGARVTLHDIPALRSFAIPHDLAEEDLPHAATTSG